jgi:hypothetical protein
MALVEWNAAYEALFGSSLKSVLDNKISDEREQIRRRLQQGGQLMQEASPNEARDGRHCVGVGGDLGPHIYKADKTTKLVDYTDTGAAMVAGSNWTGGNVTTGNNPGHAHDSTIVIPLVRNVVGRIPGLSFLNRGNGTLTLLKAQLTAWTAPGAAGTIATMWKIAGDLAISAVNPNSAGTDIFAGQGNKLLLSSGEFWGPVRTTFDDAALADGDAWVFAITANTGLADDLSLVLKVRRG